VRWQIRPVSAAKLDQLRSLIRSYGSCLIAYSGGVDSVFLARVASDVLGGRMLAVISDSPSLPRRELAEALAVAGRFGIPVRVARTREFHDPNYVANPINRCYFCKHELFDELTPIARAEGFAVIAYGENASDVGDFRPGAQAAAEFQVRAPLKEAGLTKVEIRELSVQLGLPTSHKPQMACLSSRIPHGELVTPDKLAMVEAAENVLRDLGFHDVRVRHHESRKGAEALHRPVVESGDEAAGPTVQPFHHSTSFARIEVGVTELARLLREETRASVTAALRQIGYAHVTIDERGYRRGSLNAPVSSGQPPTPAGLEEPA
jgi:uncharacterized protein